MRIVRLSMRNFRSYAAAEVELGPGVTVVTGRNGAGKTNLLDALYFGCTGRSARTTNERELVRFGELVEGTPSLRRAHMDQLVAALWPARVATRRAYNQALAQRNALVARIRAGGASLDSLSAWDRELARHGIALMADRAGAVELVADRFAARAEELGLDGDAAVAYRPRSKAVDAESLAAELAERRARD